MDDETKVEQVISIDTDGKYVFVLEFAATSAEIDRVTKTIKRWWNDPNEPVLVVWGVELQKIDTTPKE